MDKSYYDPKHPAGFGSVAKLVKVSKLMEEVWNSGCRVRTHTLYINLQGKGSLGTHTL